MLPSLAPTLAQTLAISIDTQLMLYRLIPALFVAVYGACVGSLLNVVVYRLPRGIGLVFPSSSCPSCQTKLTWRENIPVLGWLFLKGRCRFCKSSISPEYPIVELFVAVLFGVFAVLYYVVPNHAVFLGIDWGAIKPEWAQSGPGQTWPAMVVLLTLLSCLVAMTLIDARTTTIPLALPWLATLVALIVLPVHALVIQLAASGGELRSHMDVPPFHRWVAPVPPNWFWLGACLGGTLGLAVAHVMLRAGLITRSFGDYEEWEKAEIARRNPGSSPAASGADVAAAAATGEQENDPALWIAYPHARREMVRELAFIAPCGILAWAGGWLTERLVQSPNPNPFEPPIEPHMPLWLAALGGVLMGYLIGGGLVWMVRILGSIGFNKEALGLGDVHLMASVGAVCGWIDATLAFFGAAFVGVAWFLVGLALGGRVKRTMPYGPYLAAATVLVLLLKPLIELGLTRLLQQGPGMPPIRQV